MTNDKFIQIFTLPGFIDWMNSVKVSVTNPRYDGSHFGLLINIDTSSDGTIMLGTLDLDLVDVLEPAQIVTIIKSMYNTFVRGQHIGERLGRISIQNSMRELLGFDSE